MANPNTFRAFISYRHLGPDRSAALWLHDALETYRLPAAAVRAGLPSRLGRVFRDEEELAAAPDLSERIRHALECSDALIVICTPGTPDSRWVTAEIDHFFALGKGNRIFALLLEGTPEQSFPAVLQNMGREPLAADLRSVEGGSHRATRRVALLKLVAGLLEIDYDTLRRRDEERQRRRMTVAVAIGVAMFSTVTGLAVFAAVQWKRAEDQLTLAQAQRLAALGQAALAESRRGTGTHCPVCADTNRPVLLALESLRVRRTVEADALLRQSIWGRPGPSRLFSDKEVEDLAGVSIDDAGVPVLVRGEYRGSLNADNNDVLSTTRDGRLRARRWEESEGDVLREGIVIETSAGQKLQTLPHEWVVATARFSEDGRWLTTLTGHVSADSEEPSASVLPGSAVRVWDVAEGSLRTEVSWAATGGLVHAAFSPSGLFVATVVREPSLRDEGSESYRVLAWSVSPEQLLKTACASVERNLSASEWQLAMPGQPWRETCPGLPAEIE